MDDKIFSTIRNVRINCEVYYDTKQSIYSAITRNGMVHSCKYVLGILETTFQPKFFCLIYRRQINSLCGKEVIILQ